MATVDTYFAAIAPALNTDSRRDVFLELAAQRVSASSFGNAYIQAVCYLAAHMMAVAPASATDASGAGVAGPVTARSAGGWSESYGSAAGLSDISSTDASLSTTSYGREFLAIRNTRSATGPRLVLPGA